MSFASTLPCPHHWPARVSPPSEVGRANADEKVAGAPAASSLLVAQTRNHLTLNVYQLECGNERLPAPTDHARLPHQPRGLPREHAQRSRRRGRHTYRRHGVAVCGQDHGHNITRRAIGALGMPTIHHLLHSLQCSSAKSEHHLSARSLLPRAEC